MKDLGRGEGVRNNILSFRRKNLKPLSGIQLVATCKELQSQESHITLKDRVRQKARQGAGTVLERVGVHVGVGLALIRTAQVHELTTLGGAHELTEGMSGVLGSAVRSTRWDETTGHGALSIVAVAFEIGAPQSGSTATI